MKERYDVIASSLSSYFGVGFNTVQEQLDYDLGKEEKVFDDEAQDRLNLGIALEDGCLNYFETKNLIPSKLLDLIAHIIGVNLYSLLSSSIFIFLLLI